MGKYNFIFPILLILINAITIYSQIQTANVYYSKVSNKFTVKYEPINKESLAYVTYNASYEKDGWDRLALSSSDKPESIYSDYLKNYGMGYLEGYITYKRIYDHYRNNNNYKFHKNNGVMPDYIEQFMISNIEFMKKMGLKYGETDSYFHEMYILYHQFTGILDGYNNRVKEELASKGVTQESIGRDLESIAKEILYD